jgi:hypothetical protein
LSVNEVAVSYVNCNGFDPGGVGLTCRGGTLLPLGDDVTTEHSDLDISDQDAVFSTTFKAKPPRSFLIVQHTQNGRRGNNATNATQQMRRGGKFASEGSLPCLFCLDRLCVDEGKRERIFSEDDAF